MSRPAASSLIAHIAIALTVPRWLRTLRRLRMVTSLRPARSSRTRGEIDAK